MRVGDTGSMMTRFISARNRFGNRATFVDGSFDELATSIEGTIDIAVTVGVLHHVDDDTAHELLAGAYRSLRPGGRFVALEPHLHDAQHRVARELIMRDRGQHVRSEGEYLTLIEEHFDDIDVRRDEHMLRIPYTVSMYTCRKPL